MTEDDSSLLSCLHLQLQKVLWPSSWRQRTRNRTSKRDRLEALWKASKKIKLELEKICRQTGVFGVFEVTKEAM